MGVKIMPISQSIARCLGCSPLVASRVEPILRSRPGYRDDLPPWQFTKLAWKSFNAYRTRVVHSGGDDPAWDLMAPAPVEEGAVA
jgi:hypothetical protein